MASVKTVRIHANIPWHAKRSDSSNRWIGVCEALNLSMEAETLDELHSVIPEAIHLLMMDLLEDEELAEYLREKGWQADNLPSDKTDVTFDVPWHLIAEGGRWFRTTPSLMR
jgi:hypothetical protein